MEHLANKYIMFTLRVPINMEGIINDSTGYLLLGLGDVILPSFIIKYFSINIKYKSLSIVSYVVGLCLAMYVSYQFSSGQPALLFIIPCIHFVVFITAYFSSDISDLTQSGVDNGVSTYTNVTNNCQLINDTNRNIELPMI